MLGPVLGGVVLHSLGWRWMFLLSVTVGVVAVVLARAVMPDETPPAQGTRLDVIGVALLGPGFASLLLMLSKAELPYVAGLILLAGYAVHALRRDQPLVDLRLFARRGFTASVLVMALTGLAMYACLVVLPLHFQQARGHSALAAGLLVAPVGIGGAIAAPLAGRVSDRIGSRNLAMAGGLVAALSAFAFTWVGARTSDVWVVLAGVAIGVGLGFVGPPAMGSLYRTLPGPLVPQGSSVLYMLNQLGAHHGNRRQPARRSPRRVLVPDRRRSHPAGR